MQQQQASSEVFVARQPIFNAEQAVHGYELLFRSSRENRFDGTDPDTATLEVISSAFTAIGLDELTDGRWAYINFSESLLNRNVVELLPRETVTIEILESVKPTPAVRTSCEKLRKLGYRLAVDDFVCMDPRMDLVDLADVIKVDFARVPPDQRESVCRKLQDGKLEVLAEKVETAEEFEAAASWGCELFQGYFFAKPVVHVGRQLEGNKFAHLRLLEAVNRSELSLEDLEGIIKQDPSLAYKLLRLINSAWFGFRREIESVKHALVLLGDVEIRKWASLVTLRQLGSDKPQELLLRAMIRGRVGERIAADAGLADRANELFLMGVFSAIDAMIDQPMDKALASLPISEDVKQALVGRPGRFRDVFETITAYEQGQWTEFIRQATDLDLNPCSVATAFADSYQWGQEAFAMI